MTRGFAASSRGSGSTKLCPTYKHHPRNFHQNPISRLGWKCWQSLGKQTKRQTDINLLFNRLAASPRQPAAQGAMPPAYKPLPGKKSPSPGIEPAYLRRHQISPNLAATHGTGGSAAWWFCRPLINLCVTSKHPLIKCYQNRPGRLGVDRPQSLENYQTAGHHPFI